MYIRTKHVQSVRCIVQYVFLCTSMARKKENEKRKKGEEGNSTLTFFKQEEDQRKASKLPVVFIMNIQNY